MTNAKGVSKRVLILNHNLTGRGTWFRAIKVAEHLQNRGYQVTMVSTGSGLYRGKKILKSRSKLKSPNGKSIQFFESPGWTFCHGPDGGWSPLGILWRLCYLAPQKFDVVYTFSHKPVDFYPAWLNHVIYKATWITDWCDLWGEDGLHQMMAKKRGPANTFQDKIDDFVTKIEGVFETSILKKSDCVTVISEFLREKAKGLGVSKKKIYKLKSGSETDKISVLNKNDCRKKMGLPEDGLYLGYITNWYPEEDFFLQAVSRVFEKNKDVHLVSTGPEFDSQKKYFPDADAKKRLHALGRVSYWKIPLILGASDVLLLPLANTTFNQSRWPHKIGDYMAAGRPVVVCDVGDVAKFVKEHSIGLVSKPDSEDFGAAISRLLSDKNTRSQMGKKARKVAEESMRWEMICDEFLDYLKKQKLIR